MRVHSIFKKFRYPLNPTYSYCSFLSPHSKTLTSSTPALLVSIIPGSNPTDSAIFLSGYHSFSQFISSKASKYDLSRTFLYGSNLPHSCSSSNLCISKVWFLDYRACRYFSSSSKTVGTLGSDRNVKHYSVSSGEISSIIDIVKGQGDDMESKLDSVGLNLSLSSVVEILLSLNVGKVPALRFFEWLRDVHPHHSRNANICSLMIDNCGWMGDYATMLSVLKDFRKSNISLTGNAFGFLPLLGTSKETAKNSIRGVIEVLNEVGGTCCNSGIRSLIELLCSLNLIDLAKFVTEITERKASYYSILVKHICVRGQFEEARNVLEEMWEIGCGPNAKAYNYFISSLCKQGRVDEGMSVMEEMLHRGCLPDVITFEILIYFACKCGRSEDAHKLYNRMVSQGIQPRLSSHAAFIRGSFNAQQFEKAYQYVVDTAAKDISSVQGIYELLAGRHLKHGDLLVAHNLLVEMIEKGLQPKNSLYVRVLKHLHRTRKDQFAKNLKARLSSLMRKFSASAG